LTIDSASATNVGSYDVIVFNPYSSVVTLNVVFFFQGAAQAANGTVDFSWLTTPGIPYQVQYTTNLSGSNWVNLGAAIVAFNGVTTASDNLGPDAQRFYRVIQQ